jgi:hypothetical protein
MEIKESDINKQVNKIANSTTLIIELKILKDINNLK